jgi:hypothetical protein
LWLFCFLSMMMRRLLVLLTALVPASCDSEVWFLDAIFCCSCSQSNSHLSTNWSHKFE